MCRGRIGSLEYATGIYHFCTSSEQISTCVVEPGTPEDLGKVVRSSRPAISGAAAKMSYP